MVFAAIVEPVSVENPTAEAVMEYPSRLDAATSVLVVSDDTPKVESVMDATEIDAPEMVETDKVEFTMRLLATVLCVVIVEALTVLNTS
jgi:hypothetical protein